MLLLILLSGACTTSSGPTTTVQAPQHAPPALGQGSQRAITYSHTLTGGNLDIDPGVLALCPDVNPPSSVTDSSDTRQGFEQALISIAHCMLSGGMKGKSLVLVGHPERRADPDYSLALGVRRADTVRYALVRLDVPEDRIHVSSSEEIEAAGLDADTSKQERRVDILLADAP